MQHTFVFFFKKNFVFVKRNVAFWLLRRLPSDVFLSIPLIILQSPHTVEIRTTIEPIWWYISEEKKNLMCVEKLLRDANFSHCFSP
jgi:hypothetical protein